MNGKARIKLPESFKEPGTPEGVLFRGRGTNLKTGKEIPYSVPDTISKQGLESIVKNIRLPVHHEALVYDLQELFD